MRIQIIINDSPYGNERSYNALRLADVLIKLDEEVEVTVCLLGDAIFCAKKG